MPSEHGHFRVAAASCVRMRDAVSANDSWNDVAIRIIVHAGGSAVRARDFHSSRSRLTAATVLLGPGFPR